MSLSLLDGNLTPAGFRLRLAALVGLTLVAAGATLAAPRFAQPQWYHNFADQRTLLGIPHALNVLSNLPFVAVGLLGVWLVLSPAARRPGGPFLEAGERWRFGVLFAAIALTGVGSAYYHAAPGNETLVWDRLPLAVAFMAFFAITLAERVHRKAAALFVPLVLLGGASVLYWHLSEAHGGGDLRVYLFVQFYPLLAVPVVLLLFPPRYTRGADLVAALLCYLLAKALELLDAQVYAGGGIVSGHTLKHLVAGLSAGWLLYMVQKRRPVSGAPVGQAFQPDGCPSRARSAAE
jgi:hypothetical protein